MKAYTNTLRSLFLAAALAPSSWMLAEETEATVPSPSRQTGDVTEDGGQVNLTDVIYLLNWLYLGGDEPILATCESGSGSFVPQFAGGKAGHTADVDGDGSINITDAMRLVNWLFLGGRAPEPMFCAAGGSV